MPAKTTSSSSSRGGGNKARSSSTTSRSSSTRSKDSGRKTTGGSGAKSTSGTKSGAAAAKEAKTPAAKSKSAETASAPAKKAEALSLIDDEGPKKKKPETVRPKGKALPPISRIRGPKTPEPEAAPVAKAEPQAEAKPAEEAVDLIGASPKPSQPAKAEPAAAPPAEESEAKEAPVLIQDGDEKIIHIKPPIIVRELAQAIGLKPFQLISELMQMNIFAAINHTIEPDTAAKICETHGFVFELEKREKGGGVHKVEEVVEAPPPPVIEEEDDLKLRPPIITFMGHVDHGKTSLMDAIRKARVASGEAGGITQHIGAYAVEHNGQKIAFIDTPGHAAFTAMRARGANVTDIVVLVVAADDGIMPQTKEAISHAKAAKAPIMVAINKIDLPTANLDRVKGQLQEAGLTPEDWGGETICVPVSATKGDGIDDLLEMMLLQAEVLELKSNPNAPARGRVIEAQMEAGRGPTASVIVQFGTLKQGDAFICGDYYGKVKSMLDDHNQQLKAAGPSTPVKLMGFSGLVSAGDEVVVMESEKQAKALSEERLEEKRREKLATPSRPTLESFLSSGPAAKKLRLIIKADVQGSLEAIEGALKSIDSKKVELNLIHTAVGPISDTDVMLASASEAIIIGFNVKLESVAVASAKREGVQVKLYSIIYELIDQVKEAMSGLLDPETRESVIGHAEIKAVFSIAKGKVGGCMVTDGRIARNGRARVTRGRQAVFDGPIATLRRFQDEVKEVRAGLECGIKLGDFNDYEVGDVIECYQLEKVPQEL